MIFGHLILRIISQNETKNTIQPDIQWERKSNIFGRIELNLEEEIK